MASETETHDRKSYFGFVYIYVAFVTRCWQNLCRGIDAVLQRILLAFEPVYSVLVAIYRSIQGIYRSLANVVHGVVYYAKAMINFEYRAYMRSILAKPKTWNEMLKAQIRKKLLVPAKNQGIKLKKQIKEQLLEMRIYVRGFRELCRRWFLLLSDLVPGGQVTVIVVLLLLAVLLAFEMIHYSRLVFKVIDFFLSALLFILRPVIWTLQDVWSIVYSILAIFGTLLYNIFALVTKMLGNTAAFVLKALGGFISAIFRVFIWFMQLKYVQLVWKTIFKCTAKTFEFLFVTVIPFLALVILEFSSFSWKVGAFLHEKFATINVEDSEIEDDLFSFTRIFTVILITYCLIWAYRWRNKFPKDRCSEMDDSPGFALGKHVESPRKSRRAPGNNRDGKKTSLEKRTQNNNEINIQYSSQAHICPAFIRGECSRGRRCDNHHCPLPYHWQYRAPLEGWKSFSAHDNDVMERLYCDVCNDTVTTDDVTPDLSSSASFIRSAARRPDGDSNVRIEFEEMRMEINRYRTDIRRLSTVSYAKGSGSEPLSTEWVWYRLEDDGTWTEYGQEGHPTQEHIETAFFKRDSSYSFKSPQNDSLKIYFFMKPMYERNMSPRHAGLRRTVRRRPCDKSDGNQW